MAAWILENIVWVGLAAGVALVGIKVAIFRLFARMSREERNGSGT